MKYDRKKVERYRAMYPKGAKIELERMDDPYTVMPKGLKGIVDFVDDIAQIHCVWENGSSLALIPGEDAFHIFEEQEPATGAGSDGSDG